MRPFILFALVMLGSACPGQPYEPCLDPSDCDPEVSDGCSKVPGSSQGWCSSICQEAADCPPGPHGEAAECIQAGHDRVCSLDIS